MTITRTPLCTISYCPAPSDPDWHACVHCGSTTIEHHHVEGRGKKRTMDKRKVVALCVPIHKAISLNEYGDAILDLDGSKLYRIWNLKNETIHEGVHSWMQSDPVLSAAAEASDPVQKFSAAAPSAGEEGGPAELAVKTPTPPALDTLDDDWADMSDEQLQALYEAAEQRQGISFLVKCKAVWTFKEKHDWGDAWPEHAYELFQASRRTLYAYANIWAICVTSDTVVVEKIGKLTDSKSLMQSIGRRSLEDGKVAMEAAVAHYAEFGEAPTVAALVQRLGVESGERVSVQRWTAPEIAQERLAWHAAHSEEHSDMDCGPCGWVSDLLVFMEGR